MCRVSYSGMGAVVALTAFGGVNGADFLQNSLSGRSFSTVATPTNLKDANKIIKPNDLRRLPLALGEIEKIEPKVKIKTRPQQDPAPNRQSRGGATKTVKYTVSTKGRVTSDFSTFSREINETLNDARGWSRLGMNFVQVQSGGDFNLILSQPELLPSFSSGCSAEWSCRVGASVIINDKRWASASNSWNQAGGNKRDYRHMVINHEVGHWLGHGHYNCPGPGQSAPVMQQQSISLQGCKFNPWPVGSELWTSRK